MNSLQQITDAWGNWMNTKLNGGGVWYTASTNFNKHDSLDDYKEKQTTSTVQSISYNSSNPATKNSDVAYSLWYDNGTELPQMNDFIYGTESTQTFAWSITEALAIGVETGASVGAPDEMYVSGKITATLSLSATQTTTETSTIHLSTKTTIFVPPNSSVQATALINTESINVNFTASVLLSGCVAVWFNNKVDFNVPGGKGPNLHHLWFIPIFNVLNDCIVNNVIDTTGYVLVPDGSGIIATAKGTFSGSTGVNITVSPKQYPLRNTDSKTILPDATFLPVSNSNLLVFPGAQ